MLYDPQYNICVMFFLIVLAVFYFKDRFFFDLKNRIYTVLLIAIITDIIFDTMSAFTISYPDSVPLSVNYFVCIVFMAMQIVVTALYMYYALAIAGYDFRRNKLLMVLLGLPSAITVLAVLTTADTQLVLYFSPEKVYMHGPAFIYLYVIVFFSMAVAVIAVMWQSRRIPVMQRVVVYFFNILIISAMSVQFFNSRLLVTSIGMGVGMLSMYLTFQNPRDDIDLPTGTLKVTALRVVMDDIFQHKKLDGLTAVVIVLRDVPFLAGMLSGSAIDQLRSRIAIFLTAAAPRGAKVFQLDQSSFIILCDVDDFEDVSAVIIERFRAPFELTDLTLSVGVNVCRIILSEVDPSSDSFVYLASSAAAAAEKEPSGTVLAVDRRVIDVISRRRHIERNLAGFEDNGCLSLVFQPIYDLNAGMYTSAEALLRMNDEEYGAIPPDEFIPIAEQYGLINRIGLFVIDETYRFIRENSLSALGVATMHVNLSVIECLQPDLADSVLSLRGEYSAEETRLLLELTETATSAMSDEIIKMMQKLSSEGISFVLDDYGKGYSNPSTLVNFPFITVKLDRALVQDCLTNSKTETVLSNTVNMLRELGFTIIAEGVETEENLKKMREIGVDMIQGFYFTRPLKADDFVGFVSAENKKPALATAKEL